MVRVDFEIELEAPELELEWWRVLWERRWELDLELELSAFVLFVL